MEHSDETAAARVVQSCTPDRGAAALAAGRAARAASAAAIVPGTLLSPALFAIRPLSASSAAGPGRDITKRSSQPPRRGGAPATTAPRSSARRVQTASSRSRSPAAPGRRPRPAPNKPRRARCARRRGWQPRLTGWPYEADAALRGSAGGPGWRSCGVKGSKEMARQASETASGAWTLLAGSERAGFNGSRRLTPKIYSRQPDMSGSLTFCLSKMVFRK